MYRVLVTFYRNPVAPAGTGNARACYVAGASADNALCRTLSRLHRRVAGFLMHYAEVSELPPLRVRGRPRPGIPVKRCNIRRMYTVIIRHARLAVLHYRDKTVYRVSAESVNDARHKAAMRLMRHYVRWTWGGYTMDMPYIHAIIARRMPRLRARRGQDNGTR